MHGEQETFRVLLYNEPLIKMCKNVWMPLDSHKDISRDVRLPVLASPSAGMPHMLLLVHQQIRKSHAETS